MYGSSHEVQLNTKQQAQTTKPMRAQRQQADKQAQADDTHRLMLLLKRKDKVNLRAYAVQDLCGQTQTHSHPGEVGPPGFQVAAGGDVLLHSHHQP